MYETAKKGMTKKSIFASPDNVNGRVGIGTCGMSGRPMTEFTTAEKWRKGMLIGGRGKTKTDNRVGSIFCNRMETFTA
ncbi:hypothetical protein L9F63_027062, partial [Diploptera punctata]